MIVAENVVFIFRPLVNKNFLPGSRTVPRRGGRSLDRESPTAESSLPPTFGPRVHPARAGRTPAHPQVPVKEPDPKKAQKFVSNGGPGELWWAKRIPGPFSGGGCTKHTDRLSRVILFGTGVSKIKGFLSSTWKKRTVKQGGGHGDHSQPRT